MKEPTHYPLCWPATMPRAKAREKGAFKTTLPSALANVQSSLRLFGQDSGKAVAGVVLSSNVTLGQNRPDDPGVAVWFTWDGMQVCIPVDRYQTTEGNLQAIHHIIEARRTELRHGSLSLVRASFQGFLALPGAKASAKWWDVLGLPSNARVDQVQEAFRRLSAERHPDKPGGSHEAMAELTSARDQALRGLRT